MVTLLMISALLVGPLFVIRSAFRIEPSPTAPAFPAALIPSAGAYLGAFAAPRRGEDPKDAVLRLESQIGRKLAIDHQYYRWDESIPTPQEYWDAARGRLPFMSWNARTADGSTVEWGDIADGAQDDWIAAQADAIKAFGYPIYLTFHHEPEDDLATWGTPTEYAAAFRHIVTVFRSRGVTNVAFVWTMMNWTFDPRSGRDPDPYYPGDAYVDFIGIDGYNWYPGRSGAPWESFQQIFQNSNAFAVAHDKPWMVVETGCQEDPGQPGRKGQWFRDIAAAAKGWPLLKAVIYFDIIKEYAWASDTSASSMRGFAALARDAHFDGTPSGVSPSDPTLRNDLDLGPSGSRVLADEGTVGDPFSKVVTT